MTTGRRCPGRRNGERRRAWRPQGPAPRPLSASSDPFHRLPGAPRRLPPSFPRPTRAGSNRMIPHRAAPSPALCRPAGPGCTLSGRNVPRAPRHPAPSSASASTDAAWNPSSAILLLRTVAAPDSPLFVAHPPVRMERPLLPERARSVATCTPRSGAPRWLLPHAPRSRPLQEKPFEFEHPACTWHRQPRRGPVPQSLFRRRPFTRASRVPASWIRAEPLRRGLP
jgi:hypothetical protein